MVFRKTTQEEKINNYFDKKGTRACPFLSFIKLSKAAIEVNGFFTINNSGEKASIITTVPGGTVIKNNRAVQTMGANENLVIGDGTGYALKNGQYPAFNGQCLIAGGMFDGEKQYITCDESNNTVYTKAQGVAAVTYADIKAKEEENQ